MSPKKKKVEVSGIEAATNLAIDAIEDMATPKCSIEEYVSALKEVQSHLEVALEAAENDLRRNRE